MSLVMVDIIMQYWDWTGDDAFFQRRADMTLSPDT